MSQTRRFATILALALGFAGQPCAWALADAGAPTEAEIAAHVQREETRARIQREREALDQRRRKDEAACYQRFAVEDCLSGVRAKAHEVQTRLRQEELQINDAERRDKTAQRLRSIEQKQQDAKDAAAGTAPRTPAPRVSASSRAQHESDARERAVRQQTHERTRQAENASRAAAQPGREAEARERFDEKQKAAEERRAKHHKAESDAAASGRKPAGGLPTPP